MAFALIQTASRPLLSDDGVAAASPAEADRAVATLRADYERWSRWALGVAAFAATAGGLFVAAGLAATMAALGIVSPADVAVVVVAALLAAAGVALLVALWRSGRALTRGASSWVRAPYANGARAPRGAGWVQARTVNLEPRILVRLITATLALLIAVGGLALFARDVAAGFSLMTVPALLVGLAAGLSGVGQIGGVMRIGGGMSAGDPLWSRLTGTARRS
ncbi:hypothetical protein [Microbacterium oleivorans]|uniref:Uncharacterized protein n=1 Tax=Microbacterium oleivorans TaxID=273677 RepID=A0A7D5IQ26_9MICO|nr:hypothetical protein [Microbacterium oleivorans]QLD11341.1 hypothetical protein HW566_05860 [Microbacterium oleivorans]